MTSCSFTGHASGSGSDTEFDRCLEITLKEDYVLNIFHASTL